MKKVSPAAAHDEEDDGIRRKNGNAEGEKGIRKNRIKEGFYENYREEDPFDFL